MKKFLKKKYTTILMIVLILLSILTGYYSYKLRQTYQNTLNNEYNESFNEAVNLINNVENFLAKAMISKDSEIVLFVICHEPLHAATLRFTFSKLYCSFYHTFWV